MAGTEFLVWRKSRRCEANGCVEVAYAARSVQVRDGKDPDGPRLTLSPPDWAAFVSWVRRSEA